MMSQLSEGDVQHLRWIYGRMAEVHGESCNLDYMIRFQHILDKLDRNAAGKKTSEEWLAAAKDTILLDPDGWDRGNFQYSFFEERITQSEFFRRLSMSTVRGRAD